MTNDKFHKYSLMAQLFERRQQFFLASKHWELAYKYSLREDNRNWCHARSLLCEHLELLKDKSALPVYFLS